MYRKKGRGWTKHIDFMLLDVLCMQIAFIVSFFRDGGAGSFVPFAGDTLKKQAESLWHMAEDLDDSFDEVIRCLLSISGRIAVTGMGKSGHVARKVAATLASTGSPAYFIHPAEASHGDLGMVSRHDAVIAFFPIPVKRPN